MFIACHGSLILISKGEADNATAGYCVPTGTPVSEGGHAPQRETIHRKL